MNDDWKPHVSAAQVDLQVALSGTREQALTHLLDARENIIKAIEALEAQEEDEPVGA